MPSGIKRLILSQRAKLRRFTITKEETKRINKILARPRIHKIRKGTGQKIRKATFNTVADFVINQRKKKK